MPVKGWPTNRHSVSTSAVPSGDREWNWVCDTEDPSPSKSASFLDAASELGLSDGAGPTQRNERSSPREATCQQNRIASQLERARPNRCGPALKAHMPTAPGGNGHETARVVPSAENPAT